MRKGKDEIKEGRQGHEVNRETDKKKKTTSFGCFAMETLVT